MNGTEDPTDDGRQTRLPNEALARIGTRLRAHYSGAVVDSLPPSFGALLEALAQERSPAQGGGATTGASTDASDRDDAPRGSETG